MTSLPPFIYSPLQDSIKEIRLIVLQPSRSDTDPVQCKIIHAPMDSQLEYEALSYMWGSPKDSREISLGGKEVTIRNNLWWALYYLRHSLTPRVLWIDALCINQEDVRERNHQVSQMRQIYSNANMVLVWLGKEAEESDTAMNWIARADMELEPLKELDLLAEKNWVLAGVALSNLCRRKYWDRLWIVQEICLAKRLRIHCGSKAVEWSAFRSLLAKIMAARLRGDKKYRIFQRSLKYHIAYKLGTIREIRANQRQGQKQDSLSYLCLETKNSICLDPRDKIYGLLGLIWDDIPPSSIDVDYSKTVFEVFEDAIWHEYRQETSNDGQLLHFAFELQNSFARVVSSRSIAESKMIRNLFSLPPSESGRLIQMQAWVVGRIESLIPAQSTEPNKSNVTWPLNNTKSAKLELQSEKKPGVKIISKFLLEESYKIFPIFSTFSYAIEDAEMKLSAKSSSNGAQQFAANQNRLSMLPGSDSIDTSTFQIFKTTVSHTGGHLFDDDPNIPPPNTRSLHGIVPEVVRVGDILCRLDYEKEKTYFVLRWEADRYIFVARSFVTGGTPYDAPTEHVVVYITSSVLQLLTSSYIPGLWSVLKRPE